MADKATTTLDKKGMPRHVAIIMDGNGRWAKKQGVPRAKGHEAGAKSVRAVIESSRELGVANLSLYAFSTENWRRTKGEVNALFRLLSKYIRLELENIHKEDIRVRISGRRDGLSAKTNEELDYCENHTRNNKSMTLNVAINYGGRAEIADAAQAIAADVKDGKLSLKAVDEDLFARYLYLPEMPEVDLLIRTSGEQRISNFMLWQASYAEIVFVKTLWPDFRGRHLIQAIGEFQARNRRFGGR